MGVTWFDAYQLNPAAGCVCSRFLRICHLLWATLRMGTDLDSTVAVCVWV